MKTECQSRWTVAAVLNVLIALSAGAAAASETLVSRVKTPHVIATFGPALSVATPGAAVDFVLHQQIAEGWHTYWENPGDSGQRIAIDWSLPAGVTAGSLRYPVPRAIPLGPMVNYGYTGETTVLAEVSIPAEWPAGRPLSIKARASWLVCKEICIPEETRFSILLPTGAASVPLESLRELHARARASMPTPAPWPVSVRDVGDTLILTVGAPLDPAAAAGGYFFPRHWGEINHAAEQRVRPAADGVEFVLPKGEVPPDRVLEGVLSLGTSGQIGYLVRASVTGAPEPRAPPTAEGKAPTVVATEPYDAARLAAILANGGAVFVNVTADWCVICKINEQTALSADAFRNSLAAHGITYMMGNWTQRDPELTALLERFGRNGVPLYVIFPRGGGTPRVLPQLLSESIVTDALAGP